MQIAASRVSINSLTFLSPVKMRENMLVSIRNSAMPLISLSKLAGYFVGRFVPVGPSAEDLVVRSALRPALRCFFKVLQFLEYFRGSFRICDAEPAISLEGQFD